MEEISSISRHAGNDRLSNVIAIDFLRLFQACRIFHARQSTDFPYRSSYSNSLYFF